MHGVVTNRDLLVGILREPEFAAGAIDTGYLDRHRPADAVPADRRRPGRCTCWRWPWPGRPGGASRRPVLATLPVRLA